MGLFRRKRRYRRRRNYTNSRWSADRWELGSETKRGVLIVIIFAVAFLSLLSIFDAVGALGVHIRGGLSAFFGWGDWLFPVLLLVLGFSMLFSERFALRAINYFGLFLLIASYSVLMHLFVRNLEYGEIVEQGIGGGMLGYFIGANLVKAAGFGGSLIISISLVLIGLFIFFNTSFSQIGAGFRSVGSVANIFRRGSSDKDELEEDEETGEEIDEDETEDTDEEEEESEEEEVEDDIEKSDEDSAEEPQKRARKPMPKIDIPINFLSASTGKPAGGDIKLNSKKIQKTFDNFGIEVAMSDVNVGPTVTQYTMKPSEGVKLSQITALQNDLSLALAAHPIRIEAPIPGKSLVGIELPNQSISTVRLRDIIESEVYEKRKHNLMIALGKDVTGRPLMANLTSMPHLLIAGATGSGKSVSINSLIISLLFQNSADELKLILVDPKRVELSNYNNIPHLLTPVITDVDKTINALRWVVNEMDERYKTLAAAGKRNIQSFNSSRLVQKMPYIVVIIDELADLMAVAAKEVEAAIIRLSQMARAVGIHLILATQRPSVNVITGLIKANITTRIAFSVASQTDSRTIIDSSGAEKLLGNGDMLYISAELSKPKRIQGAFVSEKEINAVTEHLRKHGEPDYQSDVTERSRGGSGVTRLGSDGDEEDLMTASEVVVRAKRASATLLQSRMRIGFAKASRILDQLEERGIIGPAQNSKPREVLITEEELNQYTAGGSPEPEPTYAEAEEPESDDYEDDKEPEDDDQDELDDEEIVEGEEDEGDEDEKPDEEEELDEDDKR